MNSVSSETAHAHRSNNAAMSDRLQTPAAVGAGHCNLSENAVWDIVDSRLSGETFEVLSLR
jgi:hypothetical protein